MRMLALSLAFFRCSFVLSLPWFLGLIIGIGWVHAVWLLQPQGVAFGTSMQACALVWVIGFGTDSGMCNMRGYHQGKLAQQYSIIYVQLSGDFSYLHQLFLGI